MSLEYVANESMKVNFDIQTNPGDAVYTTDPGIDLVKVVPVKSTNCFAPSGNKICTTGITITWTLATGGCPHTSVLYDFIAGGGAVSPSATKVKANSALVLRVGDTGTCAGTWKLKASPFTVEACACNVEISDAGQDKVRAQ